MASLAALAGLALGTANAEEVVPAAEAALVAPAPVLELTTSNPQESAPALAVAEPLSVPAVPVDAGSDLNSMAVESQVSDPTFVLPLDATATTAPMRFLATPFPAVPLSASEPRVVALPDAEAAPEMPASITFDPQGFLNETGFASWYGEEFAGRLTASGEIYDPTALTVAHQTFPMGALVEIQNLDNGRRTLARVNDRGPYVDKRILDCSLGAAHALGFVGRGLARVRIRLLDTDVNIASVLARRARPLIEDTAAPVPSAHAAADRLALAGPPASVAAASREDLRRETKRADIMVRRASVLPFPALVHACRWLANVVLGPNGAEGTKRQQRKLLDATGIRGFVLLFTR